MHGMITRYELRQLLGASMGESTARKPFTLLLVSLHRSGSTSLRLDEESAAAAFENALLRIRRVLYQQHVIARLDETKVVIVMHGAAKAADAEKLAEQICIEIARPVVIGGDAIEFGCNVGIVERAESMANS